MRRGGYWTWFGIEKPFPWTVLLWPFLWVWGFIAERWHRRAFEDFPAPLSVLDTYRSTDPFWTILDNGSRELMLQDGGKLTVGAGPNLEAMYSYQSVLPENPFDPTTWFADDLVFAWQDNYGVVRVDRRDDNPDEFDRTQKQWDDLMAVVDEIILKDELL